MRVGITLTSSVEVGEEYIELTKMVAKNLAINNFGIVYGGTDYGMMKELAESYKSAGGKDLVGVMAEDLMNVTKGYKAYPTLDEKHIVPTMEDRKKTIIQLSDGFIVLPGGYGTFEEIGAIVGSKVNKLHSKPVAILNYKGFYNELIEFFKVLSKKCFSKIEFSDVVYINSDVQAIIKYLLEYTPSDIPDKFVR